MASSVRCGVENDQLDPGEATLSEPTEELGPKHLVFGVARVKIEHFPVPASGHPGSNHHRPGHRPMVLAAVQLGAINKDVRELGVVETAVPEGGDFVVELSTDP